jgi:cytochrome c
MKLQAILPAVLVSTVALFGASGSAFAADAEAAAALAKTSGCMKCHAIAEKKEGPAFKETAKKMKGKADAEQKLFTHLTTKPKVKLEDGSEEEHSGLKTKDEAAIKNVIQWILAQ